MTFASSNMNNMTSPEVFKDVLGIGNGRYYSLDIETNTAAARYQYANGTDSNHPSGLDPRVASVLTVSIVGSDGSVFSLDSPNEDSLLNATMNYLSMVRGTLVGWNINFFDLPFLCVRLGNVPKHGHNGSIWFHNQTNSTAVPKYGFPEWRNLVHHREWNSVEVVGCKVVDISDHFKPVAEKLGVKHSLKPVAKALGLNPVEVDASEVHRLTPTERSTYCTSDAQTVLDLVDWVREND